MYRYRRQLLAALGTSSVVALAGCTSSGDDEESDPPEDDEEAEPEDEGTDDSDRSIQTPTATLTTPTPSEPTTPTETSTDTSPPAEQTGRFGPSDSGDDFGDPLAVSDDGTTAIVGAGAEDDPNGTLSGAAYVFVKSGGSWSQQAKLTADDGDKLDRFGEESVALSGDGATAIVGAWRDDEPNDSLSGSAYVFEQSGGSWGQQAKLAADDGDSRDFFGSSIGLSSDGTTAVIAARGDEDPNGEDEDAMGAGAAYVFETSGNTWNQKAKIAANDGDGGDSLGTSVAVSADGTTAIVGTVQDGDPNGTLAGSAYVFAENGGSWGQQAKLTADDGDSRDQLSYSLALSADGTRALVGARNDEDPNGEDDDERGGGSVYVFEGDSGSWSQQAKFAAEDGDGGDWFGYSVSLSGDGTTAIISAPLDDYSDKQDAGSAYIFEQSDGTWAQQSKLVAGDSETAAIFGRSAVLSADGTTAIITASSSLSAPAYVFE